MKRLRRLCSGLVSLFDSALAFADSGRVVFYRCEALWSHGGIDTFTRLDDMLDAWEANPNAHNWAGPRCAYLVSPFGERAIPFDVLDRMVKERSR